MLFAILLLLIVLWLFGYIAFPLTNYALFTIAGRTITLNDLLVFAVIIWLIDVLPSPFREIATVLFVLWILGVLGIISIVGFSSLVMVAFIVGLIGYIIRYVKWGGGWW